MICNNCKAEFEGNYCPHCGQRPNSGRIVFRESAKDVLEHYFDFDAPLFRTIRDLFIRPGKLIRNYIYGMRKHYSHPIRYFILVLAIYLIVKNLIGFDPIETFSRAIGAQEMPNPDTTDTKASDFFAEHINSFLPIFAFTLGIFSKLFFWKSKYHFIEHIVLGFYTVSQYMFISIFVILLTLLSPKIFLLNYMIVIGYAAYVFMSFHGGFWGVRLIKSILGVVLAWLIYAMLGFFLSLIIITSFNL